MRKEKLEKITYECQIGMYFSDIKYFSNGFVVYSDIVEDSSWNFYTGFTYTSIKEFLKSIDEVKLFFKKIKRNFALRISPSCRVSKRVLHYIKSNFLFVNDDATLLTKSFNIKRELKNYSFIQIDNKSEKKLFIDTFITSKSQTLKNDAYPPLPQYYFKALNESFNKITNWTFKHYLSLYKNKPIGMISVCQKDAFAGLYGGGTFVKHRGKGVFTNLLNYIYLELKPQGVKYFFGITEKDSKNEKFYNRIGWSTKFISSLFIEQ